MRTRLGSLLVAVTIAAALTACGGGDGKITIGKAGDPPVTSSEDSTADDTTTDDTTPGDATTDDTVMEDFGTIPDIGDLPGNIEACVELATAMSSMAGSITGQSIPQESQDRIDEIKASLPDDVRDAVETVVSAYEKVGEAGGDFMEAADAVSSPEFEAATNRLSEYLAANCEG